MSPAGIELLSRFEAYKKSMGHALPTLADINEGEGSDEDDDFETEMEASDSGKPSDAP